MSKILENLWLGNYRDALNDQFINENEINVYFEYKGKSIYEVWSKVK